MVMTTLIKIIKNNHFLIFTTLNVSQSDMIFVIKRSESQVFKAKRNTALVRPEGNRFDFAPSRQLRDDELESPQSWTSITLRHAMHSEV